MKGADVSGMAELVTFSEARFALGFCGIFLALSSVLGTEDWKPKETDLQITTKSATITRPLGPSMEEWDRWSWRWRLTLGIKNKYGSELELSVYLEVYRLGEYWEQQRVTAKVGSAAATDVGFSYYSETLGTPPTPPDLPYRVMAQTSIKHGIEVYTFEWTIDQGNLNEAEIKTDPPLTVYAVDCPSPQPGVLTVGSGTGCMHTSIQSAIDAAQNGQTILVCGGRYLENITIGKSLHLIGIGSPVIDAQGKGDVVQSPRPRRR